MSHHTQDPVCPLCEEKLKTAHEYLGTWFRKLKAKYSNVHIAWAWRGPEDQAAALKTGHSELSFPHSPHNFTMGGAPYSLALDLFQEDEDGVARWSTTFFAKVNAENEAEKEPLMWGGKWKSIGDGCHFQVGGSLIPLKC